MTGPELEPRRFPMPAPESDPRFTRGLIFDAAAVLVQHGYPELTGLDMVELQQALFRFLYDSTAGAR